MQAVSNRILERTHSIVSGPAGVLVTEIVLVPAIAVVAALLTWQLLPGDRAGVDTRIEPGVTIRSSATGGDRIDLSSLHLFGQAPANRERAQSGAEPADAPETRLNLRLQGVFATGDGNGLAIIAAGNAEESVFTVGDRVAGQARVDGIYADRVILERNGSLETLKLAAEGVATRAAVNDTEREAGGNRDLQRIAGKARELRSRLMSNPLELARMVRFQPYLRDGELIGYRIQPRAADAQLLSELGLRPTDVITSINGVELSDPAKAQQVLRQMQTADSISVSWLRDGEQRQMTIPIGSPS
ncbi:MAG: type II secretion system protein GspC [Halofilum sp. (in: g-proteobacteria)]|nr:type II secretion system protein GspC [Halofilum sp. (in: g-proteobacteria)]